MLKYIIQECFSYPCAACKRNLPANAAGLCPDCFESLPLIRPPLCPACGGENSGILETCNNCLAEKRPWKHAVAAMRMEGTGRELIHRFKYRNETALARTLGNIAAEAWKKANLPADFIVPMPLHWIRYLTRGYNQAYLLSEILSEQTGLPLKAILKRKKWTPKQAKLNRKERKSNLSEAFSVKKQVFFENSVILLVDDVLTTGSTLSAASSALLEAGIHEVNILVLARG